ncbi:MAG: Zn-ribbon domain-containing OB-fold protein [bacterium]
MSHDSTSYNRPLPEPTAVTQPFWDGLKQHKLMLQRSKKGKTTIYYPRSVSPFGPKDELTWVECSGKGEVYSFTVARRPTAPQWSDAGPYVIAIVELNEGARVTANIVECPPENVQIGMKVEAVYEDVTPEVTLLQFRPV